MQWQGMAQGAEPQVFGMRSQVGEYGQGIGVYGKLLIKRVFKSRKNVVSVLVRVQPEGQDVFDQCRMIMSGRALEFDIGAETQGFGHNGFFVVSNRERKAIILY